MSQTNDPIKIWYQGFTDPTIHKIYVDKLRAHLDEIADENVTIRFEGISPPASHVHPVEELRCSISAIKNALKAEQEGYDAFVLGHFQEAGIHEIKSILSIPAIALGEASMLYGCTLGRKIGLITIDPLFIPWHEDQVIRAGLKERVIGIRAMQTSPADYMRAFAEEEIYQEVWSQFQEQARHLLDQGADVLIPAGVLPMLLLAKEDCVKIEGAPVMNGINVLVKLAESAVRLKRIDGLAVSRRSNYAPPSELAMAEFKRIF